MPFDACFIDDIVPAKEGTALMQNQPHLPRKKRKRNRQVFHYVRFFGLMRPPPPKPAPETIFFFLVVEVLDIEDNSLQRRI